MYKLIKWLKVKNYRVFSDKYICEKNNFWNIIICWYKLNFNIDIYTYI